MSSRYLLDTNVFIEARNRYYRFDICPGFWASLVTQHESRRVFSIDRVAKELAAQNDDISTWIDKDVRKSFFKQTADQAVIDKFHEMVTWVFAQPQFTTAAKTDFASVADGWLTAYAAVNSLVVVTHEEYAPEAKRTVPIPNVCVEFKVPYADPFKMLRDLGERFVRSTKRKRVRGRPQSDR